MKTPVTRDRLDALDDVALGVVCPMANEASTAVRFVNEVLDECGSHRFKSVSFFAVLDRASKDNTLDLLLEQAKRRQGLHVVWSPENRNVVDAYVRGYREALSAGCDWILEIDAGYSHQPSEIPQFFSKMLEGYACVFGSRFCNGGQMIDVPLKRRLISRAGTVLSNALLHTRLTDMTSGFQMFSRAALQTVLERGIRSQGPFFQTEMKAHCHDMLVTEVPITYRSPHHDMNNATLKDALVNLWRVSRQKREGRQ
jgi:dolichol-phosphate mannosyltransferase